MNVMLPYSTTKKSKKTQKETKITSTTPQPKSEKESKHIFQSKTELYGFERLGGIDDKITEIRQLVEYNLTHPEIYEKLNVDPPKGILIHGPPGCGKTMLAKSVAGEMNVKLFQITAPELTGRVASEGETKIRDLFEAALTQAPSVIFIDEIDVLSPKAGSNRGDADSKIVAQLKSSFDALVESKKPVIVIGATNRPDAIDAGLRRAGRFDREIALGIPNEEQRKSIIEKIIHNVTVQDIDPSYLAKRTAGYVGADIDALTKEAAISAVHRVFSQKVGKDSIKEIEDIFGNGTNELLEKQSVCDYLKEKTEKLSEVEMSQLVIIQDDFEKALKVVQPSAKREGFTTIPDVTWDNIGGMDEVHNELKRLVVGSIQYPLLYRRFGIDSSSGILLYGPPGCGKTYCAKALANECKANFIAVKGPQLLNKYVGEAERAVRQLFSRARNSAPCVIFFDEIDALAPKRSEDSSGVSRIVNQLLTELDGMDNRKDVFVVAATNRPDCIDPAMLRPGRLDRLISVDLPNEEARIDILKTICKRQRVPLDENVDLEKIAKSKKLVGFSCADLTSLVKEASIRALDECVASIGVENAEKNGGTVKEEHFYGALEKIKRSVSVEDEKEYLRIKQTILSQN